MIRLWNTLPNETRLKDNYPDFLNSMHLKYKIHEYKIKNSFHYDTEIDTIYMKLRFQCSALNADEFKFNFTDNSKCTQCNKNKQETIHYYFMDCIKYTQQRNILKNHIENTHNNFQNLSNRQFIHIIQGQKSEEVDDKIYKNIYQFIKLYIVTTGRFAA